MPNEPLEEVRDYQKAQVDTAAQAALTATDHLARLAEVHLQAGKELIAVLQSHGQQVLSAKDFGTLAEANSILINTLIANGVKVSQDLFTIGSQYVQEAKEQASTAVAHNASKAGEAGKAVQEAFANGTQAFKKGGARASR